MNVLYSSTQLLKRLYSYKFVSENDLYLSKITTIDTRIIFEFSKKCGWVTIEDHCTPTLTDEGMELAKLSIDRFEKEVIRKMLYSYILKISPAWSNRILYGRKEASIFMSKDEQACFIEAGLLSENPEMAVIEWWDQIANILRQKNNINKNDIGRRGEFLTIIYEKERTGISPTWISIDSNLTGYDIRSQISEDNNRALLIEVKTSSKSVESAHFHVTSNEWSVASTAESYAFYLWHLSEKQKMLAILRPDIVKEYIPSNNRSGKWESVKIPYSTFKEFFIEIT